MALSDLYIRLKADATGFVAGMRSAKKEAGTTSKTIKEAENKFFSLQNQLKKAQFGSAQWKKLKADVSAARIEMERMRKEAGLMNKMQGGASGFMSGLKGGIIGGGAVGAGMALVGGAKAAFSETMTLITEFDDSIRKVAATSRASAGDMTKLRDAAIEMGSKTRFTSSQAAEALNYMALAGWDANKSISALPGVLNLAAAAGTDLGVTSDIVTDTMSAFMMQAEQSTEVADIFAAAQSRTNTTVEMLGEAMKYTAPIMASANQTLADSAALLGLLANQGIKGSMAGTAVNSMFKDMKAKADDGTLAFGKMNIALYDQEGRFRNIFDIIGEMKEATKGLTTQQRDAITGGIFEERSIKAINILLNTTEAQINDVALAMNNASGEGQRMKDIMEGGVGGAMRNAESAWEGFKLSLGDGKSAKFVYQFSASVADALRNMKTEIDKTENSAQGWISVLGRLTIYTPYKIWKDSISGVIDKQKQLTQSTRKLSAETLAAWNSLGGKKAVVNPIGVLALPNSEDDTTTPKPPKPDAKTIVTPASIYRELNKELAATKSHMDLMGDSASYAEEAAKKVEQAIGAIFKNGGTEASKYAEKLKAEYQGIIDATRSPQSDLQLLPTLKMGEVKSDTKKSGLPFSDGKDVLKGYRAELTLIGKEAQAFGDQYDLLGARMGAVQSATQKGLQAGMLEGQLSPLIAEYNELAKAMDNISLSQQLMSEFAGAAETSFAQMASGADGASGALASFGKTALLAGLDALKGQLLAAIGAQAKWAGKLGPFGIPIAGAAIGALFGLIKGAVSKTKSVKLAEGGLISGRTMAEIGEYPGASTNPEVVSPLDKLTAMIKKAVWGDGVMTSALSAGHMTDNAGAAMAGIQNYAPPKMPNLLGPLEKLPGLMKVARPAETTTQLHEFIIKGDTLVTVLSNAQRKMTKFK